MQQKIASRNGSFRSHPGPRVGVGWGMRSTCGGCCRSWCRSGWRLCWSRTAVRWLPGRRASARRWSCAHSCLPPWGQWLACQSCRPEIKLKRIRHFEFASFYDINSTHPVGNLRSYINFGITVWKLWRIGRSKLEFYMRLESKKPTTHRIN